MSIKRFEPDELIDYYRQIRQSTSTSTFMRSPAHKKTQEMWCAAHFGRAFQKHIKPCFIDIAIQDLQTDSDFELIVDHASFPFQITEIQTPGRRRGDEYKNEAEPEFHRDDWVPGTELGPEWIRNGIANKVEKNYAFSENLNLLVYLNFSALSQDYIKIRDASEGLLKSFASVWLLNGNAFCCISHNQSLPTIEGWKEIPQSLVYDQP